MYDPITGRFLSHDPLMYHDSYNLYQAFGNDPINRVDPWGEESLPDAHIMPLGRGRSKIGTFVTSPSNQTVFLPNILFRIVPLGHILVTISHQYCKKHKCSPVYIVYVGEKWFIHEYQKNLYNVYERALKQKILRDERGMRDRILYPSDEDQAAIDWIVKIVDIAFLIWGGWEIQSVIKGGLKAFLKWRARRELVKYGAFRTSKAIAEEAAKIGLENKRVVRRLEKLGETIHNLIIRRTLKGKIKDPGHVTKVKNYLRSLEKTKKVLERAKNSPSFTKDQKDLIREGLEITKKLIDEINRWLP